MQYLHIFKYWFHFVGEIFQHFSIQTNVEYNSHLSLWFFCFGALYALTFEQISNETDFEFSLYCSIFLTLNSFTPANYLKTFSYNQTLINKNKQLKIHPIHLGTSLPAVAWLQIQLQIELQLCLLLDAFSCSWMPFAVNFMVMLQLSLSLVTSMAPLSAALDYPLTFFLWVCFSSDMLGLITNLLWLAKVTSKKQPTITIEKGGRYNYGSVSNNNGSENPKQDVTKQ